MMFSLGAHGLYESSQCAYLSSFFQSLGPSSRTSVQWLMRYTPYTRRSSRATYRQSAVPGPICF